jgi:hypothetical protein
MTAPCLGASQIVLRRQAHSAFAVHDWVWVNLLHEPSASLPATTKGKLAPRFYEPHQILQWIGDVACHVRLPNGAKIHNVSHVGVTKAFRGMPPAQIFLYRRCTIAGSFRRHLRCCTTIWSVDSGTFLFAGRASLPVKLPGSPCIQAAIPIVRARGRALSEGGERCYGR